jgi:hypothetical protein
MLFRYCCPLKSLNVLRIIQYNTIQYNRSAKNKGGGSCPPAPLVFTALRLNEKAAKAAYSKSFPWKSNLEVH